MLGKYISFAALACGFAILVVPSDDAEMVATEGMADTDSSSFFNNADDQDTSDWLAGDHTLDREIDGHFYADAIVEGASVRMLVDTGASVIALTAEDADAAGIQWDERQIRRIGSGASGAVYGIPTRLSEVEIGGMVRRNVSAVIIPEGLGISLLGQSYLKQIGAVEIADDKMVLSAQ